MIELLTLDKDGRAIEGPRRSSLYYAASCSPKMRQPLERASAYRGETEVRVAYRHKFFRYDRYGQPMRDTLVEFYVPEALLVEGQPSHVALASVAERMGWDDRG